ncbi:FHA domain-containing protein [Paenibacillus amylolyticus]|uniref:FHA domain-containing protein n=1 Tax=Paenibacillus amylolyticus TaxID=1451 RepID=A0A5M9WPC8_PAEAM|nr:DUF6382 domain-containing protein [Paenibacillus amylolyticus]KAA8783466.1 FHA domain-containing protein [Paenibacillus amylolyticus]
MYGLTRDFVRNGGTFMILEKTDGLRMEELSRIQIGMLTSNRIPRMLPLFTREIDQNVTLQYDISGYKMLSQMLKSSQISLTVLYNLLFQLAEALAECRLYMLEPQNLCIQEDYIFIQGAMAQGEFGLVYVPIMNAHARQEKQTPQLFRDLVIKLMAHVQEIEGEGIQRVLQLCDDERWDIRQLRELLLELSTGQPARLVSSQLPEKKSDASFNYNKADIEQSDRHQRERQQIIKLDADIKKVAPYAKSLLHRPTAAGQLSTINTNYFHQNQTSTQLESSSSFVSADQENVVMEEQNSVTGSSRTTYIWLGCMVAMALVWRFIYMQEPGQNAMILSTVLSIVLIAGASWMWKRMGGSPDKSDVRPLFSLSLLGRKKDKGAKVEEEMFQESWRWNAMDKSKEDKVKSIESLPAAAVDEDHTSSRLRHMSTSSKNLTSEDMLNPLYTAEQGREGGNTSELHLRASAAEATVNLQPLAGLANKDRSSNAPSYYLERTLNKGERSERVDVKGASFVIGRAADMVQYVDNSTGVSRAHVELSRGQSGYAIKDLGSVNGTMLQGNLLAPYKEYPLTDGDTFILVESVYVYRVAG